MPNKPTRQQIDAAMRVLLWLSENCDDGETRDSIALTRHALDEEIERREAKAKS